MRTSKKLMILLAITLSILQLTACAANPVPAAGSSAAQTAPELVLTLEELAEFNGQDGKPAYIAVEGIVYDVTKVAQWKGGKHNGFEAGKDLTKEIKTMSPHGVSKLKGVPVVGKIKE